MRLLREGSRHQPPLQTGKPRPGVGRPGSRPHAPPACHPMAAILAGAASCWSGLNPRPQPPALSRCCPDGGPHTTPRAPGATEPRTGPGTSLSTTLPTPDFSCPQMGKPRHREEVILGPRWQNQDVQDRRAHGGDRAVWGLVTLPNREGRHSCPGPWGPPQEAGLSPHHPTGTPATHLVPVWAPCPVPPGPWPGPDLGEHGGLRGHPGREGPGRQQHPRPALGGRRPRRAPAAPA